MCITEVDIEHIATLFREEGFAEGYAEEFEKGLTEGGILMLKKLVKDGAISLSDAAKASGMSVPEFQSYTVK